MLATDARGKRPLTWSIGLFLFVIIWTLASMAGRALTEAIGGTLFFALAFRPVMLGEVSPVLAGSILGWLAGLALGLLQWGVLRFWLGAARWSVLWIPLTGFGIGLGEVLSSFAGESRFGPSTNTVVYVLLPTVVATCQVPGLRCWLRGALFWPALVALSWMTVAAVPLSPEASDVVGTALTGVALMGLTLLHVRTARRGQSITATRD